jgi:hypothetical protein
LRSDEFGEIGIGVHATHAFLAVSDLDIAQCASLDMTPESFPRTA